MATVKDKSVRFMTYKDYGARLLTLRRNSSCPTFGLTASSTLNWVGAQALDSA